MKFTYYYSNLLKTNGVPHIGVKQYQYIFNLMALEIRLDEQNKIIQALPNGDAKAALNKHNFNLYNKLNNLTKGKEPKEIMRALMDSIE